MVRYPTHLGIKAPDCTWLISFEYSVIFDICWHWYLTLIFWMYVQKQSPEACNFITKETLALVFSCEFCEISKNTFLQNISGGCFRVYASSIGIWLWVFLDVEINDTNKSILIWNMGVCLAGILLGAFLVASF